MWVAILQALARGAFRAVESTKSDAVYRKKSTYLSRASELLDVKKPEEALIAVEEAIKVGGESVSTWELKSEAHLMLGRWEQAAACLREAIRLNPGEAMYFSNLAIALKYCDKLNEALDAINRALGLNANLPGPWSTKAGLLSQLNRPAESLNCSERALLLQPDLIPALTHKAFALVMLGREMEALRFFDAVLSQGPRQAPVLAMKGVALCQGRQFSEGMECIRSARALAARGHAPTVLEAHEDTVLISRAKSKLDDYDDMIAVCSKLPLVFAMPGVEGVRFANDHLWIRIHVMSSEAKHEITKLFASHSDLKLGFEGVGEVCSPLEYASEDGLSSSALPSSAAERHPKRFADQAKPQSVIRGLAALAFCFAMLIFLVNRCSSRESQASQGAQPAVPSPEPPQVHFSIADVVAHCHPSSQAKNVTVALDGVHPDTISVMQCPMEFNEGASYLIATQPAARQICVAEIKDGRGVGDFGLRSLEGRDKKAIFTIEGMSRGDEGKTIVELTEPGNEVIAEGPLWTRYPVACQRL